MIEDVEGFGLVVAGLQACLRQIKYIIKNMLLKWIQKQMHKV
jgi:hypothetical protein